MPAAKCLYVICLHEASSGRWWHIMASVLRVWMFVFVMSVWLCLATAHAPHIIIIIIIVDVVVAMKMAKWLYGSQTA